MYYFYFSVITKPPYEVTETGWGEFEVVIKIYFNDPNERPVNIFLPQAIQNKYFVSQHFYLEFFFCVYSICHFNFFLLIILFGCNTEVDCLTTGHF